MTDPLTLRPVSEQDLPVMEALINDPDVAGAFAWYGWRDARLFRRAWEEHRLAGDDEGALIVVREQQVLGFVNWRRKSATRAGFYWEIGIALLPEARGQGHGTLAQRLLVRYLFTHTTAHRIEAATEADNIAERKALEKAGFTQEGVLRDIGWRDGAWRDAAIYGILRTDLDVVRFTIVMWLIWIRGRWIWGCCAACGCCGCARSSSRPG
jgi:RimJ/RimL family protein N-acetyltransferase